ncbi:MAG: metallophosphoesterase family protein [Deltaproteobacteria bacterium]|nr:metallophosphoesterase family protein [Deltaproteobacteria bacterium]
MRLLFATDLHQAQASATAFSTRLSGADLLVLGGDLTLYGGASDAKRVVESFDHAGVEWLAVPGNTDLDEVSTWLTDKGRNLHGRGVRRGRVGLVGCGGSNRTPLFTPNELTEDEIDAALRGGLAELDRSELDALVVVSHVPPKDTVADRLFSGEHVGSTALRRFIEEVRPDLCLCGHIHESVGADHLGPTLVCNPGALSHRRFADVSLADEGMTCRIMTVELGAAQRVREEVVGAFLKLKGYAAWRISPQGLAVVENRTSPS